jgi:hypothetical protein
MKVICPVVSILGDNLSQNLLCGKLENKHSSSCRMSRACLTFNCDKDNLPHVCQSFPVHLELQLTRAALGVSYGSFTPSFASSNLEDWKQFQPPGGFNRPDAIALRKFREKIADSLLKSVLRSHCILNAFHGVDFGFAVLPTLLSQQHLQTSCIPLSLEFSNWMSPTFMEGGGGAAGACEDMAAVFFLLI